MNKQLKLRLEKMRRTWANIKVTRKQRDIIHGYIFADGYVTPSGSLQVDQGIKQEKFTKWLYKELASLRTNSPISQVTRVHSKTGKTSYSSRFYTRALLKGFRSMWYKTVIDAKGKPKNIKQLPKSIACFFNSTTISLWYASDGTKRTDCRGVNFEVTAFTPKERLLLKELFMKKFNISANVIRAGVSTSGTEQWNLAISATDYEKFHELVTQMDLIPTLFPHKLHKKQR